MAKCVICRKSAVSGNAVSHSQIHTKRKFKPNLQKVCGVMVCTKCLKTLKKGHEEAMPEEIAGIIEEKVEAIEEADKVAHEQEVAEEAKDEKKPEESEDK